MVVDDPQRAKEVLTARGFVNKICDVIAIPLNDEKGAMDKVLNSLMECNVNINYIYSSFGYEEEKSAVIVHTEDIFEAETILKNKGFACM